MASATVILPITDKSPLVSLNRMHGTYQFFVFVFAVDAGDFHVDGRPGVNITRTESIPVLVQQEDVVNPYPIAIPCRKIATPAKSSQQKGNDVIVRAIHRRRDNLASLFSGFVLPASC